MWRLGDVDNGVSAGRACICVSSAVFYPFFDTFVAEYVVAGKSDGLVGGVESIGADDACLSSVELCFEGAVHGRRALV